MMTAHKQSPAIMHMEYRIHLPDHDWVIAEPDKLIWRGKEVLCRIGADVEWVNVDEVIILNNQLEVTPNIRDVPVTDPLSEWGLSPWIENLIVSHAAAVKPRASVRATSSGYPAVCTSSPHTVSAPRGALP
ncbi:hypothetical protein EVAR_18485_1 [Eumeta japonica]|uniref:Uncharacterized protein n=1 Tax=Eumeta variegata TaxID=151549 RepID=A0A4C1V0Z0_EUMVA|nr:hypothetical protein EVAR_18485_1 [Eumeta japonica]